jgi:hypothetical protein
VEQEMPAPGVADSERLLPTESVEHRHRVCSLDGDVVRLLRGGRLEAALLVIGDATRGGELVDQAVEVVRAHPRTAMQHQHPRSVLWPGRPPADGPTADVDGERVRFHAIERTRPVRSGVAFDSWAMSVPARAGQRLFGRSAKTR